MYKITVCIVIGIDHFATVKNLSNVTSETSAQTLRR